LTTCAAASSTCSPVNPEEPNMLSKLGHNVIVALALLGAGLEGVALEFA
jgi:hypothetical protein